jgi:two-component system sensor histidine kinase KdpD
MEEQQKRIIHTLSHEFRTPLVAVNTGSELLKEQYDKLDKQRVVELIESVQRGGARLQRLVEDFMTLQQIDSGFAAVARDKYARVSSIIELAEYAVERVDESIPNAEDLEINLEIPDNDRKAFSAKVYDAQIIDVLLRLLSNAVKFAGSDQPIDISFESNADEVAILIRDRGPGLSESVLAHAIGIFGQINREVLEQQGAGLGLPIAAYYVTINDGTLRVSTPSDDAGGAVLRISFPAV